MIASDAEPLAMHDSEATSAGEQLLVPGVKPVTVRDRLDRLASLPLAPTKPQKPLDIGLFDEAARNQLSLL